MTIGFPNITRSSLIKTGEALEDCEKAKRNELAEIRSENRFEIRDSRRDSRPFFLSSASFVPGLTSARVSESSLYPGSLHPGSLHPGSLCPGSCNPGFPLEYPSRYFIRAHVIPTAHLPTFDVQRDPLVEVP